MSGARDGGPEEAVPAGRSQLRRRIPSIRNVVANYAGAGVEGLVFLLLTPFIVRRLGIEAIGVWGLVAVQIESLRLAEFGLRESVMKYVAAHQARAESASVRRVGETAMFFLALSGLVVVAIGALLIWLVLPLMVRDPAMLGTARQVMTLCLLASAISLPAGVPGILLEGLSRFDVLNAIRIAHGLVRLLFVTLSLQFGLGLVGVAAAEVAAGLTLHAMRWWSVRKLYPELLPRPVPHAEQRSRLLSFGLWSFARQCGEVLVEKSQEPILALFAGLPAVGAFYAGRRFATMPAQLIGPLANVLFPLTSELGSAGRVRALQSTVLLATKSATIVALPLALGLVFGAGAIQVNWLGNRVPEAEPVIQIFAVVFLVVAVLLPAEAILLGLGEARFLASVTLVQGLGTVILGILLVPRYGALGMGLATLAGVALQAAVQVPLAVRRCGVSPAKFIGTAFLRPLLAFLPVGLVMGSVAGRLVQGGLAALASWGAAVIAMYAVLLWWLAFDPTERATLRSHRDRLFLDQSRIKDWDRHDT